MAKLAAATNDLKKVDGESNDGDGDGRPIL
jgi:hypothetical protein